MRIFSCLICSLMCLSLVGCRGQALPAARKFSEYKLISVVGLDEGEDEPKGIALTLSAKEQSDSKLGGGKSGGESQPGDRPLLLTNEARSVALAYQQMQTYTKDYLFLGHVRYYLLGERVARAGLGRCLDYLSRDPDGRYLARLYVVEGASARDMLSKASTNTNYIADRLNAMESDVGVLSVSHALNLAHVAGLLEGARGNLLLPLIKLVDPAVHDSTAGAQKDENSEGGKEDESKKDGEKDGKKDGGKKDKSEGQNGEGASGKRDEKGASGDKDGEAPPDGPDGMSLDMDIAGYAVIVGGRMVDTIGTDLSPAVNFLQNTVFTQLIEVDSGDGSPAALRVLNGHSHLTPHWDGDQLIGLDIAIEAEAALSESQSGLSFTGADQVRPLAAQLEAWIAARLAAVLSQTQALGADVLGLGARIERKHPIRYSQLAGDWDQIFATLPITVRVEASVARSYEIN